MVYVCCSCSCTTFINSDLKRASLFLNPILYVFEYVSLRVDGLTWELLAVNYLSLQLVM